MSCRGLPPPSAHIPVGRLDRQSVEMESSQVSLVRVRICASPGEHQVVRFPYSDQVSRLEVYGILKGLAWPSRSFQKQEAFHTWLLHAALPQIQDALVQRAGHIALRRSVPSQLRQRLEGR
jgi:hypothetical protein